MQTRCLTILIALSCLATASAQSLRYHKNTACTSATGSPDDYVYYDNFTGTEIVVNKGHNPSVTTSFTFNVSGSGGSGQLTFNIGTGGAVTVTNSPTRAVHATTTGLDASPPSYTFASCSGESGCATGASGNVTTGGSPSWGGIACDNASRTVNKGVSTFYVLGASACSGNSPVTVTMSNSSGFNLATKVSVDVFVGTSGSGWLGHFYMDGTTHTQTLTIPSTLAAILEGGPISVSIVNGSYAYDSHDAPITFTVSASPTTFTCAATIAVTLTGHTTTETVTPTPSPVPTATAATSATPPVSPSPIISPAPYGSPTPLPAGPTPTPNITVSNGGAKTDVVINNPNDFYGPMRKAIEDDGRGMSAPGDGEGGGGAFGSGNGTHEGGDYDDRGQVDNLEGELDNALSGRTSAVEGISDKINGLFTRVNALGGQTFGSVSSIGMGFNSIGQAPAVGKVTLPTSIDLTEWSGLIGALRSVLLWLIRIAFFILIFRLCAAQGVRA